MSKVFSGFGTVAFNTPNGIVTTSRGHKLTDAVLVKSVDNEYLEVKSSAKATLNAPTLFEMLRDKGTGYYVIHRHFDDSNCNHDSSNWKTIGYEFPGTTGEVAAVKHFSRVNIANHGYLDIKQILPVDWGRYFELFPSKYFDTTHDRIKSLIETYCNPESNKITLEIGGNTRVVCKYNLDINFEESEQNLTYERLKGMKNTFDFILCRNSINYLSQSELDIVMGALKPGGIFIANSFRNAPEKYKLTSNELAIRINDKIIHYLLVGDQLYRHEFYARGMEDYKSLGFEAEEYGKASVLLTYTK